MHSPVNWHRSTERETKRVAVSAAACFQNKNGYRSVLDNLSTRAPARAGRRVFGSGVYRVGRLRFKPDFCVATLALFQSLVSQGKKLEPQKPNCVMSRMTSNAHFALFGLVLPLSIVFVRVCTASQSTPDDANHLWASKKASKKTSRNTSKWTSGQLWPHPQPHQPYGAPPHQAQPVLRLQ